MTELISELVCARCGRTGHVTWERRGDSKQVVSFSDCLRMDPGLPITFSCVDCGTPSAF
jgi:hypothetical protein